MACVLHPYSTWGFGMIPLELINASLPPSSEYPTLHFCLILSKKIQNHMIRLHQRNQQMYDIIT